MLAGLTALVIEDEYLIALEIQRIMETSGATAMIGKRAYPLTSHGPEIPFAIVSVSPAAGDHRQFCLHLLEQGTPVVTISSDGAHKTGIPGFDFIPVVVKPFVDDELLAAIQSALGNRRRPDVS